MGLIRRADSESVVRDAIVLDLGDLNAQAREIRKRADDEAGRVLAEARDERTRIMSGIEEQARQQGHSEGYQAGLEEGREAGKQEALAQHTEQLDQLTEKWSTALEDFNAFREDLIEQTRRDLVQFVAAIASRVARKVVELDDQTVARQLDDALALVLDPSRLIVEVHPEDRELAQQALPALLERFADSAHAELRTRETVTRGSCIVRTEHGRIDASIDEQINRIVRALVGETPQDRAATEPGDRSAA